MKQLSNQWILFVILVVSVVLRMFNFSELPFTHDEFSALSRLNFDSLSALIDGGVKIDGHPAGVQVFLFYWTKMFGVSTFAVKLPFIIFRVLSVYLTYLVGKRWFNETVGLLSAATAAGMQYTVMYSQIARPYISGLFFSLLLVYYLTKLIQNPKKNFLLNGSLFVISGALCAYNHHFSLLFAAIVGISGLFFVKKEFLLKYILLGISIFILYIPHLNIFFYQLGIAGVEEWLAKPEPDFILNYISYIFNYSSLFLLTVLGIVIGFITVGKSTKINYKHYLLLFTWFILPLLIGYVYSVHVNAVLQYSVLIFSFTFILYLIFGHLPNCSPKTNLILVGILLSVGIVSLVFERQHYKYFYQSCYIKVLEDYEEVNKKEESVLSIVQSLDHINNYYTKKLNLDTNYSRYSDFETMNSFKSFIADQSPEYEKFYLGSLHSIDPIAIPIIREFYPTIEMRNNYFGGTTYLFSKKKDTAAEVSILDFKNTVQTGWNFDAKSIIASTALSGSNSYHITSDEEWGPNFEAPLSQVVKNENTFIDVSVKAKSTAPFIGAVLVISLEIDGETVHWVGTNLEDQTTKEQSTSEWTTYHVSLKPSTKHQNNENIQLKTYLWNKEKSDFFITDFKIELRKGNPVIYGIVERI